MGPILTINVVILCQPVIAVSPDFLCVTTNVRLLIIHRRWIKQTDKQKLHIQTFTKNEFKIATMVQSDNMMLAST